MGWEVVLAVVRRAWGPIAALGGLFLAIWRFVYLGRKTEAQKAEIRDLRVKERIIEEHQKIDEATIKRQVEVGGAANTDDLNRLWGNRGRDDRVPPTKRG